ncbi:hypothetical protein MOQ_003917 [Trypanosoma cruzi marinkellei]|uniref:Uncharacterized protein n=1 Tax=Trypanosoma cruzi marinkellei TaxID=85056 RepID=K2NBI3_TRYCR|nr:hypothetical protein MOQ_003917 [Trypanosoma cruzi marinkellei]
MGKGGMRVLEDEKILLAELGKLFHVTRANARERRNTHRVEGRRRKASLPTAQMTTMAKTTGTKKRKDSREGRPPKPGSKRSRKSRTRGGSVWVVLKGGFAHVPTSEKTSTITHKTIFRGRLSERRRVQALEEAERYIQTAWQQAQEAGLLLDDGSGPNGDEGLHYLCEQYEVAAGMLRREPVGGFLKQIVDQTIPNGTPMSLTASIPMFTSVDNMGTSTQFSRDEWAGVIARENVILKRFVPWAGKEEEKEEQEQRQQQVESNKKKKKKKEEEEVEMEVEGHGEVVLQEADQVPSLYYFPIAEPLATCESTSAETGMGFRNTSGNTHSGEQARDVLPTKCIVRVRGSGRQKHTAILTSAKSVNYFKSNFMQVIRKELSGSKLPRGEEAVEGKQQHQPVSSSAGVEHVAAGSSKRNSKRRHK